VGELSLGDALATETGMKRKTLTIPDIGFIAATRVVLGVGIGLLISPGLDKHQRKTLGAALLAVGAVTTVPILVGIFGKRCDPEKLVTLAA
jgi:hypothetical protein